MKQHPIDLLPASIRARSQAGVRMGRYIASATTAVLIIVVAATHTRVSLNRAMADFTKTRDRADLVLATEEKASELREQLTQSREYVERYQQIAMPLDVSHIMAVVINAMPPGVSLDRMDVDAGARRVMRSPRSKGSVDPNERLPRVLTGELSGFAPHDRTIAEYIAALERAAPLHNVTLDYSRTRSVRGRSAREFRLSFRVDLDVRYEVLEPDDAAPQWLTSAAPEATEEVADGQ